MSSALFHKPMFETRLLASENAFVAACFETKNADTLDTVVTMRMTEARKQDEVEREEEARFHCRHKERLPSEACRSKFTRTSAHFGT